MEDGMTRQSIVMLRRTDPQSLVYSRRMLLEAERVPGAAFADCGPGDIIGRFRPTGQSGMEGLLPGSGWRRLLCLLGFCSSPRPSSAAIAKERLLNILVFDRAGDDARSLLGGRVEPIGPRFSASSGGSGRHDRSIASRR
jgi:hypothetical protein